MMVEARKGEQEIRQIRFPKWWGQVVVFLGTPTNGIMESLFILKSFGWLSLSHFVEDL